MSLKLTSLVFIIISAHSSNALQVTTLCEKEVLNSNNNTGILRFKGNPDSIADCRAFFLELEEGMSFIFTGSIYNCSVVECPMLGSLKIGGEDFCPAPGNSIMKTIGETLSLRLELSGRDKMDDYDLVYKITRVAKCGGTATADAFWNSTGQFRIESSSVGDCEWELQGIPRKTTSIAYVQFQIIGWNSSNDNNVTISVKNQPEKYLNNFDKNFFVFKPSATNTVLNVQVMNASLGWAVTFSYAVFVCPEPPILENGSFDDLPLPALNGTEVNYVCDGDYQFKESSIRYRTCMHYGDRLYWSQEDIQCVPVRRCKKEPPLLNGTVQNKIGEFKVEYDCEEGYHRANGVSKLVIDCESHDNQLYEWGVPSEPLICLQDDRDPLPTCKSWGTTPSYSIACDGDNTTGNCCRLVQPAENTQPIATTQIPHSPDAWKTVAIVFIVLTGLLAVAVIALVIILVRKSFCFKSLTSEKSNTEATELNDLPMREIPSNTKKNEDKMNPFPGVTDTMQLSEALKKQQATSKRTNTKEEPPKKALRPPDHHYANMGQHPPNLYANQSNGSGYVNAPQPASSESPYEDVAKPPITSTKPRFK